MQAQELMDNLEMDEAKAMCERALKLDRTHAGALETRALLALEEGKPAEARLVADTAFSPFNCFRFNHRKHILPCISFFSVTSLDPGSFC